ncbi:hypothetical protein [Pigmentibacter ruber]|uniref:hypothetical protein n=1 Tax=Pigmentibacter ruber TaxID=2683196 RepID=UPI00131CD558|nr:hypothetical protein [Pigmentibacter ruber]
MKKNIIIIFVALFFKLNIYSKEINSLDNFLPKSFQDYRNFVKVKNNKEHNNDNIKERYHVIKGDLNIFPTQDLKQLKKFFKFGYNINNHCQLPTYYNDYYEKTYILKETSYSEKTYILKETNYSENSYQLKRNNNLDDNVNSTIQQIKLINDRYFQVVDRNKSNYNYNPDNDIEICLPSNPYQLKSMQN